MMTQVKSKSSFIKDSFYKVTNFVSTKCKNHTSWTEITTGCRL